MSAENEGQISIYSKNLGIHLVPGRFIEYEWPKNYSPVPKIPLSVTIAMDGEILTGDVYLSPGRGAIQFTPREETLRARKKQNGVTSPIS